MIKLSYKDRAEWLEIRRGYIGGSDAGAVAGCNPYVGPYGVWLDKTGGAMGNDGGSIVTEVGSYLEQFVADKFTETTGKKVQKVNFVLVNEQYPWACADIDRRIVGEDAILECKTTNSFGNAKLIRSGEYPMTWYCQMMHYLAVTGAKKAYLAVLIASRDFQIFELERDEAEIESLMNMEWKFWEHVKDGTPPVPNAADADAVAESHQGDTVNDTPLDMTGETKLLQDYADATEALDDAQSRVNELKAQICAALGEYETGIASGFRVTWTPQTRKTFDAKRYAKDTGLDLSSYYKESTSRVFRFSKVNTAPQGE